MPNYTAHRPGGNSIAGRVYVDMVKRYLITPADLTSLVYRIPVDAGRTVLGVRARVVAAFNGTSPTVKVGNTANDDGFLVTTDLTLGTLNAMVQSLHKGTEDGTSGVTTPNAFAEGLYYAAAGQVVVTFTANDMTTGQLQLDVVYAGDVPAQRDEMAEV